MDRISRRIIILKETYSKMAFRLFFFESNQLNLAVYFLIASIVLYAGPEWFMPSLLLGNPPTVKAPCGEIVGTRSVTRYGRELAAFRGMIYEA